MIGSRILHWLKAHPAVLLAALLAVGILFVFFPQTEGEKLPAASQIDLKQETENYRQSLTEEVEKLLGEIKGVGEVRLLLTFDSSVEYEYLKEQSENTDTNAEDRSRDYSESYLLVEDGSGEPKVLAVRRILPQVSGAAVVCQGGADPLVRQQVIELLRAVLGVSAADISVLPLA